MEKSSKSSVISDEAQDKHDFSQIITTQIRNKNTVLLSTALIYIKITSGQYEPFRALIDQGSQAYLISESAAQLLGLPRYKSDIGTSNFSKAKHKIFIKIRSYFGNKAEQAYILPKLTGDLPNKMIYVDSTRW